MSKIQHQIKLTGIVKDSQDNWVDAKTHQANKVTIFKGQSPKIGTFYVNHSVEGQPVLRTAQGEYPMVFNPAGYFEPKEPLSVPVHVTLKKITGKLIYWA